MKKKIFLLLSGLLSFFASTCFYGGPSFMESFPQGDYHVKETGCFKQVDGEFIPKPRDYFEKFPPIDHPDLALAYLDFDDLLSTKVNVETRHLLIKLSSKQCNLEALHKINTNSNKQFVLNGDKVLTKNHIEKCIYKKKVGKDTMVFNLEFFLEKGLFFSFKKHQPLEFQVVQKRGDYFLIFSDKNYLESTYFESLEDIEDDNIDEEYLNICPREHALAWKLKRV